jgi:hypothetical protein
MAQNLNLTLANWSNLDINKSRMLLQTVGTRLVVSFYEKRTMKE